MLFVALLLLPLIVRAASAVAAVVAVAILGIVGVVVTAIVHFCLLLYSFFQLTPSQTMPNLI